MAPTLVIFTGTGNVLTTPTTGVTTANIAVQVGDKVVLAGGGEDQTAIGTLTASLLGGLTGALTVHQFDQTANYAPAIIASADVTGAGNLQGKLVGTSASSSKQMNCGCFIWRNHGGIGQTGKSHQAASSAPSLTLNGCLAGSAIVGFLTDWAAVNTARTYVQINGANPTERSHFADGSTYHFDTFEYADIGAAGNKTLGESAPSTQTPNLLGVEVLDAAGAAVVALPLGPRRFPLGV